MPCAEHDWIFDTPCPHCLPNAVAAAVTTPETPEATPAEVDPPAEIDLDIPYFLERNPDNTLKHPEAMLPDIHTDKRALIVHDNLLPPWQMTHDGLLRVVGSHMTVADKQPYYRELHTRTERSKARERIEKLKDLKEAQPERQAWEARPKELTRKSRTRNSPRA